MFSTPEIRKYNFSIAAKWFMFIDYLSSFILPSFISSAFMNSLYYKILFDIEINDVTILLKLQMKY